MGMASSWHRVLPSAFLMWQVLKEGELKAEVIDAKKLIDQHYYAIASKVSRA